MICEPEPKSVIGVDFERADTFQKENVPDIKFNLSDFWAIKQNRAVKVPENKINRLARDNNLSIIQVILTFEQFSVC